MLTTTGSFTGFSVRDVAVAQAFYRDVLGLTGEISEMGILSLPLPGGGHVILYPKADHEPASFTVLNFEVADIDVAVRELEAAGVTLENYGGYADEKGILRGKSVHMGPDIAWFTDPSGNILSILSS